MRPQVGALEVSRVVKNSGVFLASAVFDAAPMYCRKMIDCTVDWTNSGLDDINYSTLHDRCVCDVYLVMSESIVRFYATGRMDTRFT